MSIPTNPPNETEPVKIEKQVHQMPPDQARKTVAECVCSSCFGQLTTRYVWREGVSEVSCATEDCSCPGFVTRSWVEQAKAKNAAEAVEAKQILQKAVPWMTPANKTTNQILSELGF